MPYNKRSSDIVKKKHPQKKKRIEDINKKYTTIIPVGNSPVSRRLITKLKYTQNLLTGNITSGNSSATQFRMNSIFDPWVSGGGHQPYGHDSLALLYEKYRVFNFSWFISVGGTTDRCHVTVVPINSTTIPTQQLAGEMPLAQTQVLSYNGGRPIEFYGSLYLPNFSGLSPTEYKANKDYEAAFGADPVENMYLNWVLYNQSGATIATHFTVVLEYTVECHDTKPQTAS